MLQKIKIILFFSLLFSFYFSHSSAVTVNYEYDNLQRLTRLERSDGTIIVYNYDNIGNRTLKTITIVSTNIDAQFASDLTNGFAPLEVTLTDHSTGSVTSWLWAFGDGQTSSEQHPVHNYTNPGNYTVSLTVSGPEGSDTETKTDYITVLPADTDGDGLLDQLEMAGCTKFDDPDSDDDGLWDGVEDSNRNGQLDENETDPCNPDSDGDGMKDGWEVDNNTDPLVDDALVDFDNDGYSNLREFLSNTAPWSDQDLPGIIADFSTPNVVDGSALYMLIDEFGRVDCDAGGLCNCDVNLDGVVDEIDLFIFSEDFGRVE